MTEEEGLTPLDPDVQEALSRRHAPEVVRLLRLRSGRFAIFNHAGDLCGIVSGVVTSLTWGWPPPCWHPATKPPEPKAPPIDLKDLGLA